MQVKCDERILHNITREYKKLDYKLMFEGEIMEKLISKVNNEWVKKSHLINDCKLEIGGLKNYKNTE